MIEIVNGGSFDEDAVHLHRSNEISILDEASIPLDNSSWMIIEDPRAGFLKRKVSLTNLLNANPVTLSLDVGQQFGEIPEKITLNGLDHLLIEDSEDNFAKKHIDISSIPIEELTDGVIYKKYLDTERTKLTGIEDGADVTNATNVTTVLNTLSVNSMADITSSGADIEDAVTLKHTQGSDTTVGVQTASIDMGGNAIVDVADPTQAQEVATKNYVDNIGSHDPEAFHKNILDEFGPLPLKSGIIDIIDNFLIEDSDNSNSKARVSFIKLQQSITSLATQAESLNMGNHYINNVLDPQFLQDATTKNYVDTSLLTKQDVLTNGVDTVTAAEIDQIKNIGTTVISEDQWTSLSNTNTDFRLVYTATTTQDYYYTFRPNISDTSSEYGLFHFMMRASEPGGSYEELYEIKVFVPKDCYYDQISNPPIISIKGNTHSTSPVFLGLLPTALNTNYQFNFYVHFNDSIVGLELSIYDLDDATLRMGNTTDTGGSSYPSDAISTLSFKKNQKVSNTDSMGSVKIVSNVDTSEPTYNLVVGTDQQLIYSNPLLDSQTFFPETAPIKDVSSIYADVGGYNGIFLENPILGQPQYWRISFDYSGKILNRNAGLYVKLINPLSGFTRRLLLTLPDGEIEQTFITVDISTYSDINSLAAPFGSGLGGYQIWFEVVSDDMTVIIRDVTRLNY